MKTTKGLYRRGSIFWITYVDNEKVQHWKSTGTKKKTEAEYILHKAQAHIKEGKEPGILEQVRRRAANHTFNALCEKYREFCQNMRDAKNRGYMIDQLKVEFGGRILRSITLADVESYQSRLLSSGLASATVNRRIACLKHMLHKATDWEFLDNEAYAKIKKVKLMQEDNTRLRFLSAEEVNRLIAVCSPQLKPIITMAVNTGMRKGEILGLTWDKVDLKHGFIILDDGAVKTGRGRQIPINGLLMVALKAAFVKRRLDVPFVFPAPSGGAYVAINAPFKTACRKAGIKDFHFHDLRHTAASWWAQAGANMAVLKELLGHSNLAVTGRYSHLMVSDLK
ncbi:MAG: site-specific integrase, partial [Deltaproteobacteria bacterium]